MTSAVFVAFYAKIV